MEDLITLVVFLLFGLFGLLKHVLEKKRGRPFDTALPKAGEGGLDDWPEFQEQTKPRSAPPATRPVAPAHQRLPPRPAPTARPSAPAAPPPPVVKQKPVLTSRRVDPILEEALRKLAAAQAKQAAVEAQARPERVLVTSEPALPPLTPTTQVAEESLAAGFPAMNDLYVRTLRGGPHRLVSVRAMGVKNLRQGIIMAEILGPPRAFDI